VARDVIRQPCPVTREQPIDIPHLPDAQPNPEPESLALVFARPLVTGLILNDAVIVSLRVAQDRIARQNRHR